jgi:hypothetical protein
MKKDTIALAKLEMGSSRFVSRFAAASYGLSVLDTGAKGGSCMKAKTKKIKYTDEPLGKLRIVDDFLPSPEDLVFKEENVKVTITLSKSSVDFFKKAAKKHHTQYQKMIRSLLDQYTTHHSNNL